MKLKSIILTTLMSLACLSYAQTFNAVRNSSTTINSCTGNVYDHGGSSGNYTGNSNDTIVIFADDDTKGVQVRIESLDINNQPGNQDQIYYIGGLELVDGIGNTTTFLNSGTSGQGDYYMRSKQEDGSVTMIFEAPSGNAGGFHYSIGCYDLPSEDDINLPSVGNLEVTTCEGSIFDNGGKSNNYLDNTRSSVTLYPENEGEAIQLDLKYFGVANISDQITIYNGNTVTSPTLESSSGGTQLDQKVFQANNEYGALTVYFTADNANNSQGFEFESSCISSPFVFHDSIVPFAKNHTITTCDKQVYDNGGATGDYKNNSDGYLTILPDSEDKVIKLNVLSFDAANAVDYISVYDSSLASGLFKNVDGDSYRKEFVSTNIDGALTVRFRSDASGANDGFRLNISCVDETSNLVVPVNTSEQITTCDTVIYDNGDATGNYSTNSDGSLTILPLDDEQLVSLSPISLDIPSYNDNHSIEIYNGLTTGGDILKSYLSIDDFTFENIVSSDVSGALTIRFTSDDQTTFSGFSFNSTCTDRNVLVVPKIGNNIINSCDTVVYDNGGFTNNYVNGSNGSLTIYPNHEDSTVVVTVEELGTENNFDILTIFNDTVTSNLNSKKLVSLSGNQLPTLGVYQSSNEQGAITLEFIADNAFDDQGFKLSVSCNVKEFVVPFSGQVSAKTCDTVIYDNGGSTGNYKDGSSGYLLIEPLDTNQKVVFDLEYFETADGDVFTIYDGVNFFGTELIDRESGILPQQTIKAGDNSSGALYIRFRATDSDNARGFKIVTSCEVKEPKILVPTSGQNTIYTCNDTIYDGGGPNQDYETRYNGSLIIRPDSEDSIISLEILTYETEDIYNGDRFAIHDGASTDGDQLLIYTGTELPSPSYFESRDTTGALTIYFITNTSRNGAGFSVLAKCVSNEPEFTFPVFDETITTCDTVIYDHGGSRLFYDDRRSSFLTILPEEENQNVVINIESFNTIEGDVLTVFDGDSQFTSPELLEYSGSSITQSTFEASNTDGIIMLEFDTDFNDIESDGFKITTSCVDRPEIVEMPSSGSETITTCNATIYDDGGESGDYDSYVYSQLTILPTDPSYVVKIEIEELDIDNSDLLSIYDNTTTTDRLNFYAGTFGVGNSHIASNVDGAITLAFDSDYANESSGFKIKTSCLYNEPHVKVPASGNVTVQTCDTVILDNGGNFENYTSNSNGSLTIEPVSDDSVVVVEIIELDTRLNDDFLTVYNGPIANDSILFQDYQLAEETNVFESTRGNLTIEFTSDNSWESTGFRIETSCKKKIFTGLLSDLNNELFELYPNPNSGGKVYFNLKDLKINTIQAINVNGKVIDLDYTENTMDVNALETGVYSIRIITAESIVTKTLFVE